MSTTDSNRIQISLPLFDGKPDGVSFTRWADIVEDYLGGYETLADILTGTTVKPIATDANTAASLIWQRKDKLIKAALRTSLINNDLATSHITKEATSHDVWQALKRVYEPSTVTSLYSKLYEWLTEATTRSVADVESTGTKLKQRETSIVTIFKELAKGEDDPIPFVIKTLRKIDHLIAQAKAEASNRSPGTPQGSALIATLPNGHFAVNQKPRISQKPILILTQLLSHRIIGCLIIITRVPCHAIRHRRPGRQHPWL
ncbi:hypothetical protein SeMB42_g02955 [Synchytrium endobioticum]|uniref:Uncharacterized protein n=1 Tax=Synchytrium endobioticum TaxID=286115 RepID=A0A507DA34_9FUNG|nr:hypothetical protein SeMB42_g02955 [Synchytrium endobioticum]